MSDAERHRHWQSIASGEVQVVVGARSAVFAPARRLGLMVIDEEHESSFKQETTPRYHARDVAVKRAQMEGIPVILGSATPSLESWRNAERGRYTRLAMPSRVGDRPMPAVEIIDMRNEKTVVGGLSESLRQAMTHALDEGGQVILLLNRRGFHTFVLCPRCGHVVKCHACDVAATYHKSRHILICHTCDAERACPPACPGCGAQALHYGGIGTERLEREIQHGVSRRRRAADGLGHDALARQPRASLERVQGRRGPDLAGHSDDRQGTGLPERDLGGGGQRRHGASSAGLPGRRADLPARGAGGRTHRARRSARSGARADLLARPPRDPRGGHARLSRGSPQSELPEREKYGVPPYGRIVRLIARGPEEPAVSAYMNDLAAAFRAAADPSVRILGPAPAPIIKIRNLYRFHLQLRCPNSRPLQSLANTVPGQHPAPHGIELAIDVDPITML